MIRTEYTKVTRCGPNRKRETVEERKKPAFFVVDECERRAEPGGSHARATTDLPTVV